MDSETKTLETVVNAWAWVETNWRRLAMGAAGVAAVALVVSYIIYSRDNNALLASQRLSALRPTPAPGGGVTPVSAEAYLKVANEFAGTEASGRALLLAGGSYFEATNYSAALKQFELFQRDFANSPLRPEALFGQAASLEALGRGAEASTVYQALITRHPTSTLVPRAKLAQARLLAAQKQPEQALRILDEVGKAEQYGLMAMLVEVMQDEIKAANPGLVLKPVTATNVINVVSPPSGGTSSPAAKPVAAQPDKPAASAPAAPAAGGAKKP